MPPLPGNKIVADNVFTLIQPLLKKTDYPITTIGCIRVPATRRPMASRSTGVVNIFTSEAVEKSGRLTCIPLRIFPAVWSSTVMLGISGSSVRGCGRRASISAVVEPLQVLDADCLIQRESPCTGAPQRRQVRSATGKLAKLMRHRTYITASRDVHRKRCLIAFQSTAAESRES